MSTKSTIILAVSICSFFTAFMSASLNVAVAQMALDFEVRPHDITAAVTAYVVAATAFLLPATALANRLGYGRSFLLGSISCCLIALLVSQAGSLWFLIGARFLQGLASAIIFCSSYATLSYHIAAHERGSAIGINTAAVYLGLSLSPCLGGVLTDLWGWQSLFYTSAAGFFVATLLIRTVPNDPPNADSCPYPKMLLIFVSMLVLLFSCTQLTENVTALATLAGGLLLLGYYLYLEAHSAQQLLPVSLLRRNLTLSFELLGAMFSYMGTFAITLMLSLYFQVIIGYSASFTGLMLVILPAVQCAVSPFSGMLCNRLNPHRLVFLGILLQTLSTAIFMFISASMSLYVLIVGQICAGLGGGIFSSPNTMIIMNSVEKKEYALASSLLAIARNSGMALCMSIFTAVFAHYIRVTEHASQYSAELNQALNAGFCLSTLITTLGLLCSLKSSRAARTTHSVTDAS